MKSFAGSLALIKRHKTIRKWPIDENKGSDHQGYDVLIFGQIFPTSSIRNVRRTVRRICIFIPGIKGLN